MLKVIKNSYKFILRNRYIRCLHSAKKIALECAGKKVLITDNKQDDRLICKFLRWMGIETSIYSLTDFISFLDINENKECSYIWVTMCPRLRKKISLLLDSGLKLTDIHYIYYAVPELDINLPQQIYDIHLGLVRKDQFAGFTLWGGGGGKRYRSIH